MEAKESLELSVTPEELCRTCLAAVDRDQLKTVFCSEILDGKIVPFPKVIELITGEQVVRHEKLPNGVCVECKRKLRDVYSFITKVRSSNDLLYDIFNVAKPIPNALIEGGTDAATKVIKKCAEVQTEPERKFRSTPQLVETGTQCTDILIVRREPPALRRDAQTQTTEELKLPEKSEIVIAANSECAETRNEFSTILMEQDGVAATDGLRTESDERLADWRLVQTFKGEEVVLKHVEDEDSESEFEVRFVTSVPSAAEESNVVRQGKILLKSSKSPAGRSSSEEEQLDSAAGSAVVLEKGAEKQTCLYCNYTAQAAMFAKHFLVHQQTLELCFESIEYFRCGNCFMVFMAQEQMEEHFQDSRACIQPKHIVDEEDLSRHVSFYQNGLDVCVPKLKTFTGTVDGVYRCFRCPTVRYDFDAMRAHCIEHDLADDQADDVDQMWKTNKFDVVHICGICGAQFSDAMFIRQHVYFHQTSYFCMYDCDQICESFGYLTNHLQTKHLATALPQASGSTGTDEQRSEPPDFSCGQCKKVLRNADSLRMHVKNHARERKFACTFCSKRFTQKGDLTTHLRTHTNERPYQCFVCDKTFRTVSHRRDHMSTHAEENKFECEICHKKFKAARILAGHRRLHTGVKPYTCTVCSKTFARKHHLKQHSQVHCKR